MGTGREPDATLLSMNTTVSDESAVGLEGGEGGRGEQSRWILSKMVGKMDMGNGPRKEGDQKDDQKDKQNYSSY